MRTVYCALMDDRSSAAEWLAHSELYISGDLPLDALSDRLCAELGHGDGLASFTHEPTRTPELIQRLMELGYHRYHSVGFDDETDPDRSMRELTENLVLAALADDDAPPPAYTRFSMRLSVLQRLLQAHVTQFNAVLKAAGQPTSTQLPQSVSLMLELFGSVFRDPQAASLLPSTLGTLSKMLFALQPMELALPSEPVQFIELMRVWLVSFLSFDQPQVLCLAAESLFALATGLLSAINDNCSR